MESVTGLLFASRIWIWIALGESADDSNSTRELKVNTAWDFSENEKT